MKAHAEKCDVKVLIPVLCAVFVSGAVLGMSGCSRGPIPKVSKANTSPVEVSAPASSTSLKSDETVTLAENQQDAIRIERVGTYRFSIEKPEFGTIDYDNNVYFDANHSVPAFPHYRGTIVKTLVDLDEDVRKGQPLYTIDSPDLDEAVSVLIRASDAFDRAMGKTMDAKNAPQSRDVFHKKGKVWGMDLSGLRSARKELETARNKVRAFGKTDAEIDRMISSRKRDPELVVKSPISGRVSAVNAVPGLFVGPGKVPAPYSVAHVSVKWMLAYVPESDSPLFRVGQKAKIRIMAFPGRIFKGQVSRIYPTIDPNNHRVTIRYEISDHENELRAGMVTEFSAQVQRPLVSLAIPANGVVREGDGTMTVWVTTDRLRFVQRIVSTGIRKNGMVQILSGLRKGELVVTDGAVFLDNILQIRSNS